jgi:histidinol-phosphate/aromatic aminotransferase/cobyric acid decarboxylase-like protein/imidazoleglycerol phosphate dehydratase HisB
VSAIDVIRPDLRGLVGYRWQDTLPADAPLMRFDMNTSAVPPAWYARELARLARVVPNSYPDATFMRLRGAIAAYTGFPVEQIVPTAGADEALLLCALLSLAPGRRAYVRRPAYGYYGVVTRLAGAELVHDPDAEVDLTWVCAPHNPTGADASAEDVAERPGLVVIDQAYLEFGGTDLSGLVRERENTVCVRTLSKAFALAGIRVGYIIAPAEIAERLNGVRPPASIGVHAAALAEMALRPDHVDEMRARAAEVCAERERLAEALRAAGYPVSRSCTNFALVDIARPAEPFARELLERGLVVRTFADSLLETSIRYSVATPPEDDCLLEALGAAAPPARRDAPAAGRTAAVERRTNETDIRCRVVLDGAGRAAVATGIGMLDHMLGALAAHSLMDLDLACAGDLWVDEHHTVEDVAIVLGQALDGALGDRAGIRRFGDARAPLDNAAVHAVVDLGGRGAARIELGFTGERIGGIPASLVPHLFDSLSRHGRMAIHLTGTGADDHHLLEAAFKALALALRAAWEPDPRRAGTVPSTKGSL